ncbi:MAG: DNA polymerase III subunit delta [Candidatus Yanofskybacteria bacterium RIFCSPHIGHO2_02_FULL_41_11]|uniref:DNA polymerase III subunit delta n=1 Tax=Candidatus Yanofskybacteria bacterium RIFCSPHIGHO2_02_FULL_41_11 TaxID=1802675 RepID=A0A1F8F877_9BACT|nr:MAG: DNA polymerase III subunit delta [Candidatus Yanofskybacteria bacterium RIFCSPHIGHO2_02_FULL_41_11]
MIIFLYGSDTYRLKENVDTVVGAYHKKHKSGMSYYRFDLSGENKFDDLAEAIKSVSFFDEAKLIIVKNSFSLEPVFLNKLVSLTNDLKVAADKKTVLVFVENRTDKGLQKIDKDLFAFLNSKPNLVRNIEYLNGVKLQNWVRGEFKRYGYDVSIRVVDLLIDIVGNPAPEQARCGTGDSWALANEIEKLSNYSGQTTITEKDVNLLVNRKGDTNIFDLVDAVGNQNKAKAFEIMYRLTNSGHDPHYILVMLAYHFENLLSVADLIEKDELHPVQSSRAAVLRTRDLIASATSYGIHPFVAKKAFAQANKFTKEDLLSKFNHLAELDVASKSGQVNLEDALYNFVVS